MSPLARLAHWLALAAALLLLNMTLTVASVWPTLGVRPTARLSLETVLLAAAFALWSAAGRRISRRVLAVIAAVWVVLALSHYLEITSRALYGRSVNLYWDLKLLPDVGAMFAFVAQPRMLAAVVAGAILLPLTLYAVLRWAVGRVARASADPRMGRALATMSALAVAAGAATLVNAGADGLFVRPAAAVLAGEAWEFAHEASGAGRRPLPPAPDVSNDLSRVEGADVILLFIESYGATSWDRPEYASVLAPARHRLNEAIDASGRGVVTGLVESTTFGGESWLAHISLLSGTEVRDADVNRRLMAEHRDTLVTPFARHGYRTMAVMPGLQAPWPEGRFYGFDRIYGLPDLGYEGPPFGWWDVTDQFVIARMDALAVAPRDRAPVFVFMPSISTHAPFTPVPPYQPDWSRVLTSAPYDEGPLTRAYAEVPDWTDLGPGYARALSYTYDTLAGYLRLRADRDLVLVIVGDHQPAALVSGEGASWEVPVHVVASRPAVLERLRAHGFTEGLAPARPDLARMDTLMPILLDAFGDPR
ncbi:MAG: sulfatase-like hydrolase/transferase [Vicinamibacterales bacterium]